MIFACRTSLTKINRIQRLRKFYTSDIRFVNSRNYSDANETFSENDNLHSATNRISGFAKAYKKQSQILETQDNEQNYTFASLLRNSKLMDVSIYIVFRIMISYKLQYCLK